MKRLTKVQKEQLENLRQNSRLYVGYNCPSIMRTFDKLVEKGFAQVIESSSLGKQFEVIEGKEKYEPRHRSYRFGVNLKD